MILTITSFPDNRTHRTQALLISLKSAFVDLQLPPRPPLGVSTISIFHFELQALHLSKSSSHSAEALLSGLKSAFVDLQLIPPPPIPIHQHCPSVTLLDIVPPKAVAEEEEAFGASIQQDPEQFKWRLYQVNECQLPSFLSRLSLPKIYLIRTNAVRLLRYMLQEDYHIKYTTELFPLAHH
ncbi:hypothetical protein TYRP_013847 [Tyrophagus putrescentiae]|nr:hypothetical protein TYRP_013847 [Tyrophagus putrescentiae]